MPSVDQHRLSMPSERKLATNPHPLNKLDAWEQVELLEVNKVPLQHPVFLISLHSESSPSNLLAALCRAITLQRRHTYGLIVTADSKI